MGIVKINLHKISASRNLDSKGGQIKINNNVSITDVQDMDFSVDGKKGLRFNFLFNCNYEPGLGKAEVEGQVMYVDEEKKVSELKSTWDKGKQIPFDVMEQIVNAALHKGHIQAIKISEDVNLPSPLPLPKINRQASEEATAKAGKK